MLQSCAVPHRGAAIVCGTSPERGDALLRVSENLHPGRAAAPRMLEIDILIIYGSVAMVDANRLRVEGWPDEPSVLAERAEQLLRGLASGDERLLRSVLVVAPPRSVRTRALPAFTAALVHLAALLAVGASTTSLRWAVERALHEGACDEEIVEVLATVAAAVGTARVVAAAPRLALAIGYDIQIEVCDGY